MNAAAAATSRFTQTDREYLDTHRIPAHLTDALSLLSLAPAGKVRPLEFLAHYFTLASTSPSSLLLHRDFKHINSSAATRRQFIALFRHCFAQLGQQLDATATSACGGEDGSDGTALSPQLLHQLCCLLCADFPFSLVRNAARITNDVPNQSGASTPASSNPPAPLRFDELSHKLFVLFFYSEFLNQCALSFRSLDTHTSGRVNRRAFHARLEDVLRTKGDEFSCPPPDAVAEALQPQLHEGEDEEGLFNAFCVALFAHPKIYEALR